MAATLASLTDRIEALVMDSTNRIFDTLTIAEGLRLALGEYNLARESEALAPVTLNGLDGAAVTTLGAAHESLLVLGGAGYSSSSRAVDRAESFELENEARDLVSWAEKRLAEFRAMLRSIHPTYSGSIPGGTGGTGGEMDPGLLAATIGQLSAQSDELLARAEAIIGQESRAAAAAVQAAADRAAEAARQADLRGAAVPPWGAWVDED